MLPIAPSSLAFFAINQMRLIPLNPTSKAPLEKDWLQKTYSIEDLLAKFPSGTTTNNYGLVTGNGVVDLDLDIPAEYLPFAFRFLPHTNCSFGRRSKPRSHLLYRCPDNPPYTVVKDGKMAIEFRSDNTHQTMIPTSTHPSGETVEWSSDMKYEALPKEDSARLLQSCRTYLAACVLADNWPSGSRHFAALALTGMLLRVREVFPITFATDNDVVDFVLAVCEMSGDDELHDRKLAAANTVEKWNSGGDRKVTGGRTLEQMVGEATVATVRRLLTNDNTFERVENFNKRFATLVLGGKPGILHESDVKDFAHGAKDGVRVKKVDIWSIDAFKMDTAHEKIDVLNAKGEMKSVPFAHVWLQHPARRHFNKGIDFTPPPEKTPPECYNLFRGFQTVPRPDQLAKCQRLIDHIHENIAGGNADHAHWVTAFFADIVQNPSDRPGTALVLQGETGTGKTLLTDFVSAIIAPHGVAVNTHRHLVGHFNSHLANALLVAAHEALYAGDKQHAGTLKALITDPWLNIERKGYDSVRQRNYMRLVITTNEQWVVPASFQERRFMILEVKTEKKQDRNYFGAMIDDMSNGGYEGFMHYLLNYEYKKSDITKIPTTETLVRQQELSESPVMVWWKERLEVGEPLGSYNSSWATDGGGTWPDMVAKEAIYKDYCVWAEGQKWSSKSQSMFWVEMRRLLGLATKEPLVTNYLTKVRDFHNKDGNFSAKSRIMYVQLPELEKCRNIYEKITSTAVATASTRENNVVPLTTKKDRPQ